MNNVTSASVAFLAGFTAGYHAAASLIDSEKAVNNLIEVWNDPNAKNLLDVIIAGGIVAKDYSEQ